MTDIDKRLQTLLSEGDSTAIDKSLDETGFYAEVFNSFRGPQRAMHIMTWLGIIVFGALLIVCIIKFFGAETTRDQIFYAGAAILLNSAQIALKIWFNMRLNRIAILREIKALRLSIAEMK